MSAVRGVRVTTLGPAPSAVYRLYGNEDALLYVGVSNMPSFRVSRHIADKEWGSDVRRATVTWHPSRREGLDAEVEAIRTERPAHNLAGFAPRRQWRGGKSPLDHVPAAVTDAREKAGLTKTELARRVGCALSLISQIESGDRNATPAMLLRLADALNCPVVVLESKRDRKREKRREIRYRAPEQDGTAA